MTAEQRNIRVAVIDDDSFVRAAVSGYVAARPELDLVAEANDGQHAVELLLNNDVDVLLMDVRMPQMDGISALEALREAGISTPVIILTTFDDDEHLSAAMSAGAKGFLLKDTSPELLVESIKTVFVGGIPLSEGPAQRLVSQQRRPRQDIPDGLQFSAREIEVLGELCKACSNAEIADTLNLSESTVKSHVSSVMEKLQCTSRLKVVIKAFQMGLVHPPQESRY